MTSRFAALPYAPHVSFGFNHNSRNTMATTPTPEQSALKIIQRMVSHFGLRAEEVLPGNTIMSFLDTPMRMHEDDLKAGIEFAVNAGWVEITDRQGLRLTEIGFQSA